MEVPVTSITVLAFVCLLVIAVMSLYIPIVHIRSSNKIFKCLESIEHNTRK